MSVRNDRLDYVVEHVKAVVPGVRDAGLPTISILHMAWAHAEQNGILQHPYFGTGTRVQREQRWLTWSKHNWGIHRRRPGVRQRLLDAEGIALALDFSSGWHKGNPKTMPETMAFLRTITEAVDRSDLAYTKATNDQFGLQLPAPAPTKATRQLKAG